MISFLKVFLESFCNLSSPLTLVSTSDVSYSYSFVFPRVSDKWTRTVCSLLQMTFFSHNLMLSRFIHNVAIIRSLLLFTVEWSSVVLIYHNLFTYLPVNKNFSCFQYLAIMNITARYICLQVLVE